MNTSSDGDYLLQSPEQSPQQQPAVSCGKHLGKDLCFAEDFYE